MFFTRRLTQDICYNMLSEIEVIKSLNSDISDTSAQYQAVLKEMFSLH